MEVHQPRKPVKKQCELKRIILRDESLSVRDITAIIQDQKLKQDIGLVVNGKMLG